MTGALVRRRQQTPAPRLVFITNPINTLYGGLESPQL